MPYITALAVLVGGFLIALMTAPVGVSGAVFLLPFQLSVLDVPSPSVTPTNLLFNVVAAPGALLRYGRQGQLKTPLAALLLKGTVPGVVLGSALRVFLLADTGVFKLVAAGVLAPLGMWLCLRPPARAGAVKTAPPTYKVVGLAAAVGVVGGIYGIGGGSILAPILVGRGHPVALVAPAALVSTFVASCAGAMTYVALALVHEGAIAPSWSLGLLSGCGGLAGGYLGAAVQRSLPESLLRVALGLTALSIGMLYVVQACR